MAISRRMFLGRSSVFSLAAVLPLSAHAGHNSAVSATFDASRLDLLGRLTSESFSRNLNTSFEIQVWALNTQELELIEVSKKKVHRGIESFDLLFRGKKESQFTQGTYMINHTIMGSFPVFVVPVGNAKNGAFYQAVFSRMR